MVAKGKVSLVWQCVASPFFITGLIAFRRIKRLQDGFILYILTHLGLVGIAGVIMAVVALINGGWDKVFQNNDATIITGFIGLAGLIGVPVYFMRKWCIVWNKGFETQVT